MEAAMEGVILSKEIEIAVRGVSPTGVETAAKKICATIVWHSQLGVRTLQEGKGEGGRRRRGLVAREERGGFGMKKEVPAKELEWRRERRRETEGEREGGAAVPAPSH